MEHIIKMLEDHIADEKQRDTCFSARIAETQTDVKSIKDNHLAHLSASVSQLSTDMAWVKKSIEGMPSKVDVDWLKLLVTSTLVAIIGGIVTMIFIKLQ